MIIANLRGTADTSRPFYRKLLNAMGEEGQRKPNGKLERFGARSENDRARILPQGFWKLPWEGVRSKT